MQDRSNIYLIGDCHSVRVLENGRFNQINKKANVNVWGKAGLSCWKLNIKEMQKDNLISSRLETGEEPMEINFNSVRDNGLIMPWLGYVDIRQHLPKYNNVELIIKKYVDDIILNYPNSKLKFIEPLPQFTEMLMKYEGFNEYYSYEDRIHQNNLFISSLRSYCKHLKIEEPISQHKIYESVGVTRFTPDLCPTDRPHPVDALLGHHYKDLYDLFVKEALHTIEKSDII